MPYCVALQIEEHDKDKRRVLKKIYAEHTSKSKMKQKMLVRMTHIFVSSKSALFQVCHVLVLIDTMCVLHSSAYLMFLGGEI